MSLFDINENKDDILLRGVIVGVLASLRDSVPMTQVIDGKKETYNIPFFYSMVGSERWFQDIFLNEYKLDDEDSKNAQSFYETIPRGIMTLKDVSILNDELSNNFVRGQYTKREGSELKQYSSELFIIPLNIPSTVEVFFDTQTQVLKGIQSIIDNLYKSRVFFIHINGIRVSGSFELPEDFERDKNMNIDFDTEAKLPKVSFSMDIYVEYPVFKDETEMFSGNTMGTIEKNVSIDHDINKKEGLRAFVEDADLEPVYGERTNVWPHDPKTIFPPDGGSTSS